MTFFYPARTGINFPYFQLAVRSFRFPSQLISQYFTFQLAQILPEERVFCRAATLGTPSNFTFSMENVNKQPRNFLLLIFFFIVPWNSTSGGFAYIFEQSKCV